MAADTKRGALVFGHDESSHYSVPMTDVVKALAAQGLHVVTAADKAVLDAMAEVPYHWLQLNVGGDDYAVVRAAELARREAAK